MNSTGLLSPAGLETDTLLAGNALGTMLTEVRLCGLVMTRDEMLTAAKVLGQQGGTSDPTGRSEAVRTAILVPEEEGCAVVGPAAGVAHVDLDSLAIQPEAGEQKVKKSERWPAGATKKRAGWRLDWGADDGRETETARGLRRDGVGGRHPAPGNVGSPRQEISFWRIRTRLERARVAMRFTALRREAAAVLLCCCVANK